MRVCVCSCVCEKPLKGPLFSVETKKKNDTPLLSTSLHIKALFRSLHENVGRGESRGESGVCWSVAQSQIQTQTLIQFDLVSVSNAEARHSFAYLRVDFNAVVDSDLHFYFHS